MPRDPDDRDLRRELAAIDRVLDERLDIVIDVIDPPVVDERGRVVRPACVAESFYFGCFNPRMKETKNA